MARNPRELEKVMIDLLERGSPNWTYAAAARFVHDHLHRDLKWYFHTDGSLRRWGEREGRTPAHGVAGAGRVARRNSSEIGQERVEVDEAESKEPEVEDAGPEDTGFRHAEPENAVAEPAELSDPQPEDLTPEGSSPYQVEGAQNGILSSSLTEMMAAFHLQLAEARASASGWVGPARRDGRGDDNSPPDMDGWVVRDGENTVWNIVTAKAAQGAASAGGAAIKGDRGLDEAAVLADDASGCGTEDEDLDEIAGTTLSGGATEEEVVCPICLKPFDVPDTFRGLKMCRRCADSLR